MSIDDTGFWLQNTCNGIDGQPYPIRREFAAMWLHGKVMKSGLSKGLPVLIAVSKYKRATPHDG